MHLSVNEIRSEPQDWILWLKNKNLVAMANALGWQHIQDVELTAGPIWQAWGLTLDIVRNAKISVLANVDDVRLMVVRACDSQSHCNTIIRAVQRVNASVQMCWWWVQDKHITMLSDVPHRATIQINTLTPKSLDLLQWQRCAWQDVVWEGCLDAQSAWCRHLVQLFEQAELTRTFFHSFVDARDLLVTQMIDGPDDPQVCQQIALTALLRTLILYFLQARGALDGDVRFLWRHLTQSYAMGVSYEVDVLKPLWFGALNREKHHRTQKVQALGQFPFLNGGLFEPSSLEASRLDAYWQNETWQKVLNTAFEPYRFILFETQSSTNNIDPEVLGQVFEGLMASGVRRKTGTFYTPRCMVKTMVRRALCVHLEKRTQIDPSNLNDLFNGDATTFSDTQRTQVLNALSSVTILDPAVGTGAFLIEVIHQLRVLHQALGCQHVTFEQMRGWIHHHLFGVDTNAVAVRLCEVRLWLVLLSTLPSSINLIDEMEPLPNLGHRLVQGDSLIGLMARLNHRMDQDAQVWCQRDERIRPHIDALSKLQRAYLGAHGSTKTVIYRIIQKRQRLLMNAMIESRQHKLQNKLIQLKQAASSPDMFGQSMMTPQQQQSITALEQDLASLDALVRDRDVHALGQLGFDYTTYFPDVFAQGGFDVVVTNPPWVRANDQSPVQKRLFQALYKSASNTLWPDAKAQGIRAPYGTQVDLSALFLERAITLLKPGGVCMALVPSKLMRGLHGTALRTFLTTKHTLLSIEDMSDRDLSMFDATTYPTMLCVQKSDGQEQSSIRRAPQPHKHQVDVVVWRGARSRKWQQPASQFEGAPWVLASAHMQGRWASFTSSPRLGTWPALRPKKGIMTGCNKVFIHSANEMPDWMQAMSRPVVTGRDVRAFNVSYPKRILWPYDDMGAPKCSLSCIHAIEHFEQSRAALEARRDHRANHPLWQMFRIHESIFKPKVVWRDLGQHLEACAVGADVLPLNTTYYIGFDDDVRAWAMSVFLNHKLVRQYAFELAERARGGWRRHFAWVVCLLPVPERFANWLTNVQGDHEANALWFHWAANDLQDEAQAWLNIEFEGSSKATLASRWA